MVFPSPCHPAPSQCARDLACSLWIEDVPGILHYIFCMLGPGAWLIGFPKICKSQRDL